MSGTSVIRSNPIIHQPGRSLGIQPVWTGTPVGQFVIEVSNNWDVQAGTGTRTVYTLPMAPINPAGAAGDGLIELIDLMAAVVWLRYTNTSSTGVLRAYAVEI